MRARLFSLLMMTAVIGLPGLTPAVQLSPQMLPAAADNPDMAGMAAAVKELNLGTDGFFIGEVLTAGQLDAARGNYLEDTYPGTVKFKAGEMVVVADSESHLVLALYRQLEDVGVEAVQQMVGYLMGQFGEPTTMAHGKIIYWAYGPKGKIGTEAYEAARAIGQIDILATVKFNSTLEVTPGMGDQDSDETGTIYFIITSDRLLESYVAQP